MRTTIVPLLLCYSVSTFNGEYSTHVSLVKGILMELKDAALANGAPLDMADKIHKRLLEWSVFV